MSSPALHVSGCARNIFATAHSIQHDNLPGRPCRWRGAPIEAGDAEDIPIASVYALAASLYDPAAKRRVPSAAACSAVRDDSPSTEVDRPMRAIGSAKTCRARILSV